MSGPDAEPSRGQRPAAFPIFLWALAVHNIELIAGTRWTDGPLCRNLWPSLMSREDEFAHIKMPSGEIRLHPHQLPTPQSAV